MFMKKIQMKKSRYTDSQIISILKQAEAGTPVPELCREHGMSNASFYKWRAKYGGMDASLMARMKELEAKNNRLKKMYADVQLQNDVIKEAMAKKWLSRPGVVRWQNLLSTRGGLTFDLRARLSRSVRVAIAIRQN